MVTYRLSEEARDDLIGIVKYSVRTWGEDRARKYYWMLIEQCERIAKTPLLYPAVGHIRERYRRSVCSEHSIYYRVAKDHVEINAILRAQDEKVWLPK